MNASKLLNLLNNLPTGTEVVNEAGNLAVLDKGNKYIGWIDIRKATYNPVPVKPKKTKKEKLADLIKNLKACKGGEEGHVDADNLLLDFIDNADVTEAFINIPNMWYA